MDPSHNLYYTTPATGFPYSLPLGNGRIGVSLISAPDADKLLLNEITFWSGKPYHPRSNHGGKAAIEEMRKCYVQGDHEAVQAFAEKYLQPPKGDFGTNLGVGKLKVEYQPSEAAPYPSVESQTFERGLRLDQGIAWVRSAPEGAEDGLTREVFVSHPHQVVAIKTSSSKAAVSCNIGFEEETTSWSVKDIANGELEIYTQALETIHSGGTCGVKLHGLATVRANGHLSPSGGLITVTNASSILILVALNTDFQRSDNEDWMSLAGTQIRTALEAGYDNLKQSHIHDHQTLYSRVFLSLGPLSPASQLPTNQRQKRLASSTDSSSADDTSLYTLYFNYGRYLLIAGTRSDSPLPLHL